MAKKKETMKGLVAEYNKLTGKKVKSFKDMKEAQRKVKAARVLAKNKVKPAADKKTPAKRKTSPGRGATGPRPRHACKVAKGKKTWEFRSVQKAFTELGLPIGKLVKFRKGLAESKKAEFEGGYKFSLVAK